MLTACGSGTSKSVKLIEDVPTPDFAHDTPVGEITSMAVVDQNFVSNCNSIEAIELFGATYIRENEGTVLVSLYMVDEAPDENIRNLEYDDYKLIAQWQIDASKMEDNTLVSLKVAEANIYKADVNTKLKDKPCLISITSPDSKPGSSVTFWTTQEDVYPNGCVRITGFEQYNDLWFNVHGSK